MATTPSTVRGPLLTLVALCACGGGPRPDGGVGQWPEGALELGAEAPDGGFVAMPARVEATPGAQGGYHVPVMYRVTGEAPAVVSFEHRVTRVVDGALVSKGSRTWDAGLADPWTTDRATIVFLCPTPVGLNILGEPLRFQVTATRDGTLLGTAQATTSLGCPAGDAFCERICGGD